MKSDIRKTLFENNINRVLATLSGGADSVAMTFLLRNCGVDLMALHCNFHLRGEESDRDQKFVEDFCRNHDIPLKIKHFDVSQYLRENPGQSVEMACRNLRYDWFYSMLEETRFDRIAVAHNADDNIETFFINLLRGSGTKGLKGMIPDDGKLWRPLLSFHRKEILELLNSNGLHYIIDSSNASNDFRRNYLRNEIIPMLKKEWKGFDKAFDKSIKYLREENLVIEDTLSKILSQNNSSLPIEKVLNYPAPTLLIQRFISKAEPFSTTSSEILDAIIANKPHIRKWILKKGVVYLRNKELSIVMGHCESRS